MINSKPLPFQLEGAKQIRDWNGCALLADDMGLGKTFQSLYYVYKMRATRPVIVLCPANVKWNWRDECSMHFGLSADVVSGKAVPHEGFGLKRNILIVNYDILPYWADYLVSLQPRILIMDEVHYISDPLSIRAKATKHLAVEGMIPHRIGISGTPIPNRPFDIWQALNIIRPDLFTSHVEYGFEYCQPKKQHGKWTYNGAKNLDKLNAILTKHVMIRRLKSEVQKQLPPKDRKIIYIDLNAQDHAEYWECRYNFYKWVRKNYPEKLIRIMKAPHLAQIGYLLRLAAKLKRRAVLRFLRGIRERQPKEKVIVFTMHRNMINYLRNNLERTVVIDGRVVGINRKYILDRFNKHSKCDWALCQYKAGGVGTNMVSSRIVVSTDLPWNAAVAVQAEDRAHRMGQKRPVTIYYLIARKTIEVDLASLVLKKQQISDQALDGKKTGDRSQMDVFKQLNLLIRKKKK